jgi:hypothetical protein
LFLLLATMGGCGSRPVVSLYLYDCGGQVLKLDRSMHDVAQQWDLQSQFQALVPPGLRDGCYINGLRYDPKSRRLFTVVPKEPVVRVDGTRGYLLVAADVPAMRVAASAALPLATERAPTLEVENDTVAVRFDAPGPEAQAMVARYAAADLRPLGAAQVFRPAADPLDSDPRFLLARVAAQAGALRLVVFPEQLDHQSQISVVRAASAEVVVSFTVPPTALRSFHLSLDGSRVLVEGWNLETHGLTGQLFLYDVATQRQTAAITVPTLANADALFLCITPSLDDALYSLGARLYAVNLSTGATVPVASSVVVDKWNKCLVADR